MYRVLVDGELFCDSGINDLAIMNPVVTLEANTAGEFTFTVPVTHPYYSDIKRLISIVEVWRETKMIFRGFVTSETVDLWNNKAIVCEGELSYFNDSILRPYRWSGKTVFQLLDGYINGIHHNPPRSDDFDGHNDHVEARKRFVFNHEDSIVTVQDPNNYISCFTNMNSTMQEIKEDLVDDLGGYIRVRHVNGYNIIDYIAEGQHTSNQTIELGVNLVNYKSNIDDMEIATRVIPLGELQGEGAGGVPNLDTRLTIESVNSGLDYLESPQSVIDNFGIITKTVTFDDVTTPSRLKTKGQQWLQENQFESVTIEVSAVDLGLIDPHYDTFELLDKIRVKSPIHGLNAVFPLTKMVLNLDAPENDVFTLGSKQKVSIVARTVEALDETKKIADSVNEQTWLEEAQNRITDIINGTNGGYVVTLFDSEGRPEAMQIRNKLEANDQEDYEHGVAVAKIWQWSLGGFAYSDSVRLIPSTGKVERVWNGVAIAMDGSINANFITTGKLRSLEIDNGTNHQFKVTSGGAVTASDLTITGGGIYLGAYDSHTGKYKFQVTNAGEATASNLTIAGGGIYLGSLNQGTGKYDFDVDSNGNVTATSANIKGNITGSTISGGSITGASVSGGTVTGTSIVGGTITGVVIQSTGKDSHDYNATLKIQKNELTSVREDSSASIHIDNEELESVSTSGSNTDVARLRLGNLQVIRNSSSTYEVQISGRTGITVGNPESYTYAYVQRTGMGIRDANLTDYTAINQNGLQSSHAKSRILKTKHYNTRLLYCYETPKPTFADEGHGKLDENGVCYIYMDDIFLETIDTTHEYRVFLTKYGKGDIWIDTAEKDHFIVKGTENLEFDWKVDCIQRDYNYANLEKFSMNDEEEEPTDYGYLADEYLHNYESEVLQ